MTTYVGILVNVFNACFMVYTYHFFFNYFAPRKSKLIFHICLLTLISALLTAILSLAPMGAVRTTLFYVIPLLTSVLYKMKWYNNILLSCLIYALTLVCEFATTVIISMLFSVSTQTAVSGTFLILGIILSKMILIIIISILRILKYRIAYSLTPTRIITLLITPISTVILSMVHINWISEFPVESQPLTLSSIISYIVLIISNLTIFHLIDNSYKESEKEKQLTTVTELLQAQAVQYKQMQEHNQEVMKIRHDQKNFIIGLISELENGSVGSAKHLLKDQLDMLKKPEDFDFNNIISAVVKAKSDFAFQYSITIDFQYSELHKIQISPVDIAIILGNALDNAIEATQKIVNGNKVIQTIVKVNRDLIVIIIRNPTEKHIDTSNLISTKRNNGSKGLGIASIEKLTKKHEGEVIFRCENLVFESNIVLRNVNK